MGAWGTGSFENDDALDFLAGLDEEEDTDAVLDALDAVVDADYLEAPEASAAVAAAEVVAAMLGKPAPRLPKELGAWARSQGAPEPELLTAATKALNAVLEKSELKDLWEDSEEAERWVSGLKALLARLA